MKTRKAFTLVEILIVVILLGILATIAISSFGDLTDDAKTNAKVMTEKVIMSAVMVFIAENQAMPAADGSDLKVAPDTLANWTVVIGGTMAVPTVDITAL